MKNQKRYYQKEVTMLRCFKENVHPIFGSNSLACTQKNLERCKKDSKTSFGRRAEAPLVAVHFCKIVERR